MRNKNVYLSPVFWIILGLIILNLFQLRYFSNYALIVDSTVQDELSFIEKRADGDILSVSELTTEDEVYQEYKDIFPENWVEPKRIVKITNHIKTDEIDQKFYRYYFHIYQLNSENRNSMQLARDFEKGLEKKYVKEPSFTQLTGTGRISLLRFSGYLDEVMTKQSPNFMLNTEIVDNTFNAYLLIEPYQESDN